MSKTISEVSSLEDLQEIIRTGEPVLVDYYADWCGPCRALAPNVERVASANAGALRVIKVNIDASPELAERAKVREIPALHFYRDSQRVGVLTGFRTEPLLTNELRRHGMIAGAATTDPLPEPGTRENERTSLAGRILGLFGRPRTSDSRDGESATVFKFIESEQDLADVIDRSFQGTIPIFLHDPWCPISARAFRQMEQFGGELPTLDVSRHHLLSKEIERRTGVRHESPQVIVLRDAVAIWDASHGRVTASSLRAVIGEQLPTSSAQEEAQEAKP